MGWEEHTRCRYYPNCMIHTGERFVRDVEPDERSQIQRERKSGLSLSKIARAHKLERNQILQIVNQPVKRYATRRDWLSR